MPRGGKRANSGPKAKPKEAPVGDKGFAARVLDRIGELGLVDPKTLKPIKSAEDYALNLLRDPARGGGDHFVKLIDKRDGKPVVTVNHLHDKPIEVNHTVSFFDAIERARKRVATAK